MIELFNYQQYMPRFHCINQDITLAWLYALPNIGTFITYSLCFTRLYYLLSKKAVRAGVNSFNYLMLLYGLFFFFCGGTHLMDALALVWPAYNFFVVWEWIQFMIGLVAFSVALSIVQRLE